MVSGLPPVAGDNKHFVDVADLISLGRITDSNIYSKVMTTLRKYLTAFNFTKSAVTKQTYLIQQ